MKTKVFLVGNLARDVELRKANLGNEEVSVATLTVMNNDNDETNVYDVSVWRGLADSCAKYLKKGDKGNNVKKLQQFLNWCINAKLTVDGSFGDVTLKAVKNFQEKYGLKVDGYFGKASLKKAKSIKK